MDCKIKISNGRGTIYSWSDDCSELLNGILQLLPHQKATKQYETSQLRAFNLSGFLKANGVDVQMEIENPAEHARMTIWTAKLKSVRSAVTEAEIQNFVESIGIEFRELQVRGLKKILQSHFSLLAAGCGAGKTILNLCAAQFKKNKTGKSLVFIIAPSACAGEYTKELDRFRGYFDLTLLDTTECSSTKKVREQIADTDSNIIMVSIDSVAQLRDAISLKLQKFNGEALLIVEEGHAVKNVDSRRSQGVQAVAPLFDQVIVSSATPLPLGPKDLRGYIGLVGLPQPEDAYANGIPTQDYSLLKGVAFVTDEEDVPYAPLQTENIEFTDLENLNEQISVAVRTELEKGYKVVVFTSTNKAMETAFNLFSDVPRTVLSGSFSVTDCRNPVLSEGSNKESQRQAIDDFNKNSDCRILIANYRVGSTGLNLQYSGARMVLFYEITNCGADFYQSKYRIRRPNVFPKDGFKYVYAVPADVRLRRTVNRQFLKLASQKATLKDIKVHSGSSL